MEIGFHFSCFTDLAVISDFGLDFDLESYLDRGLLRQIAQWAVWKEVDVFIAIILNLKAIIDLRKQASLLEAGLIDKLLLVKMGECLAVLKNFILDEEQYSLVEAHLVSILVAVSCLGYLALEN